MFWKWVRSLFGKKKKAAQPEGEKVGLVTHYFSRPKAAVVRIEKGTIAIGDTLQFLGKTTNFKQRVESLQIDRKPIQEARKGQEIGLQVKARVRSNDQVYKLP
jgi:putative protease